MNDLTGRIARLEGLRALCATCAARPVFIMGEMPAPSTCPDCGAAIVARAFTIDIDRAAGREGDAG